MTYMAKCDTDDCSTFSGQDVCSCFHLIRIVIRSNSLLVIRQGDVWFKIDHAGLDVDLTTWASDDLIANNVCSNPHSTSLHPSDLRTRMPQNSWTVTVPSDIASGGYLLRHELLALHSAGTALGAQFYPMCAQVVVTGGGSASPSGVALPGAYATNDPGMFCLLDLCVPGSSHSLTQLLQVS